MKYVILTLIVLLALVACAPKEEAPAEEMTTETDAVQPVVLFAAIDADNNGEITLEEHQAQTKEWILRWDVNADGVIDGKEQYAWLDTMFDTVAGDMDEDEDDTGIIDDNKEEEMDNDDDDSFTLDQMLAFAVGDCAGIDPVLPKVKTPMYVFVHIDADGDGVITLAEHKGFIMSRFDILDLDHDGKVTEDEFFTQRKQELAVIDANGDGVISGEELFNARYGK